VTRPRNTTVNTYGMPHLTQEHQLGPVENVVLRTMAEQVPWRSTSWTWEGEIVDLIRDTGGSWRAIRQALDALVARSLIDIERRFSSRQPGRVKILCYAEIVVLSPRQKDALDRASIALQSRTNRENAIDPFLETTGLGNQVKANGVGVLSEETRTWDDLERRRRRSPVAAEDTT